MACALTGVKNLHRKALEFDVGVYFEANGHGTVLFSDRASEVFAMASEDTTLSEVARGAAKELLTLTQLINQTVGDAIADLLLVEIILLLRGVGKGWAGGFGVGCEIELYAWQLCLSIVG